MCKQPAESEPSPKTRAKNVKSSARGNFKTAPKQEKIHVFCFAPDEIGDFRAKRWTTEDQPTSIRTIHWKRGKTGLFKNVEY
jgi:hypothetical protein